MSRSAAPLATGLHQVDNPAFDRDGNLYVTFSGSRGQEAPVSIYVVAPRRHARAVRRRACRTRRRWPSTRAAGCTSPAASTAASTSSTPDGSVVDRCHAISVSPAASRSDPKASCSSAIAPDRSCGSADGQATLFASHPVERRRLPPRLRSGRVAVRRPRRRSRRATPSTASRPRAWSRRSARASAGRRASPSTATAISMSSTRLAGAAPSTASISTPRCARLRALRRRAARPGVRSRSAAWSSFERHVYRLDIALRGICQSRPRRRPYRPRRLDLTGQAGYASSASDRL